MDNILKQEMDNLKENVEEINDKVGKMYFALMGNELTKDGGLIGRIIKLERDVAVLEEKCETNSQLHEKEIQEIKTREAKSSIYVNILWAAGGVICTSIIIALINHFFK